MATEVNICLCPTEMEMNGDVYDKERLFLAIRMFVRGRLGGRTPVSVKVGHSQGVRWAMLGDGDDGEGEALLEEFWRATNEGTDQDLFISSPSV